MIVTVIKKQFVYYEKWLETLHITHIFRFFLGVLTLGVHSVLSSPEFHLDPPLLCGIMHLLRKEVKRANPLLNLL